VISRDISVTKVNKTGPYPNDTIDHTRTKAERLRDDRKKIKKDSATNPPNRVGRRKSKVKAGLRLQLN